MPSGGTSPEFDFKLGVVGRMTGDAVVPLRFSELGEETFDFKFGVVGREVGCVSKLVLSFADGEGGALPSGGTSGENELLVAAGNQEWNKLRENEETSGNSREKVNTFDVGRSVVVLVGFGRGVGSAHGEGGSNISISNGVG